MGTRAAVDRNRKPVVILMADDDDDDYHLTRDAFDEYRIINSLYRVRDGEELMDYLLLRGNYDSEVKAPRPGIILLDLNMPRKDGREALKEIKSNPELRRIPVVILTVSQLEEDVARSYDLGANSYVRKPVRFDELVELVKMLGRYWLEVVELPADN